ncbi:DHH family phosphoesterase [Gracilibacillus alcaliphilus]|uniref:DHH family phosphoesterase n=1 Tax=Gracilibacillus alcaliphilus TaxID=1401441 RepID=UPI00195B1936|nr:DHH family phosphoesterase [Gracilibacillus alcaliphilus]MBM7678703.1 c-di-AMP phosphodiesterase-like protein [Gracilibacillus alcaliphilus]
MSKWKDRLAVMGWHIISLYILAFVLLIFLFYYNWITGIVMAVIFAASLYYSIERERQLENQTEKYISMLSYRVKKVGEEALLEMPLGIILYSEEDKIQWTNPYMWQFSDAKSLAGMDLGELAAEIPVYLKEDKENFWVTIADYDFHVYHKKDERLLYLFDRTKQIEIQNLYLNEKTILATIFLDNYEEITQNMDDTPKSRINSQVTSILNKWANEHGIYLKRTSQERFMAVMNQAILTELERTKFEILDEVRELLSDNNVPLTLSIGIGTASENLPELGELSQSSLDLALGRGGDQVVIKNGETGKVRFYGGKTNPIEKRTRVRARVISHALKELVKESSRVIIMGHKSPDMDSIGASIGVLKIAQANDTEGFIVLDKDNINTGVQRLVEEIKEEEELWYHFINPDSALEMITKDTLLVIVDTHKPSLVQEERLISKTDHVVIIDHHRRGEEFIDYPTLVYMEPYASSASELITELLEYQPAKLHLSMLEATSLLAGIIVDTKSFALRTGSRTFEAASYLRSKGADTILVQKFLKEDLDTYVKRSRLIENTNIYRSNIAISVGNSRETYGPVIIAQAADILLTMSGIEASFVISEREDGRIGISARSLGNVNVQIIMERMNGGGHLTNAATQLDEISVIEAYEWLKEIIDEYCKGGEEK